MLEKFRTFRLQIQEYKIMSASQEKEIEVAEFTPKIKTYILLQIAFYLVVSVIGIPLAILWFLGIGQWYGRRYYKSLVCDLTEKHLRFRKGVIFKVEKTIPLENIQNLTFIENPLLSWLELRILKIETAGQSNPHGSDMKLVGIIGSGDFKDRVLKQRSLLLKKESSGSNDSTDNSTIMASLDEITQLLKDIKANTSK